MRYTFINGMHFETHKRSKSRKREACKIGRTRKITNNNLLCVVFIAFLSLPLSSSCERAFDKKTHIRGRQHRKRARNNWRGDSPRINNLKKKWKEKTEEKCIRSWKTCLRRLLSLMACEVVGFFPDYFLVAVSRFLWR